MRGAHFIEDGQYLLPLHSLGFNDLSKLVEAPRRGGIIFRDDRNAYLAMVNGVANLVSNVFTYEGRIIIIKHSDSCGQETDVEVSSKAKSGIRATKGQKHLPFAFSSFLLRKAKIHCDPGRETKMMMIR